ncbi:MAG: hypothetical protein ATN31_06260 [Candidatus Epulonipiscioides saccharophilum]|nr:MAG: hypothetical protein ATN31_06260 [Epulopiscium sp. AS2M-Bin001]
MQKGFDDAQGCSSVKNPRGARQRWEAFERSKIAEELLFKVPKIHLVESEEGWNTRHSLSGATSVTLIHCQGNAGSSAFL